MNEKILGENKEIRTELVLLRLLSMISAHEDAKTIFGFASGVATPEVRNNVVCNKQPKLERIYESILGLVVFEDPSLHPDHQSIVAWQAGLGSKCKKAIKQSESLSQEPKLVKIIKLMKYLENKLAQRVNFPVMTNLENGRLEMTHQTQPLIQRSMFNP